MATHSKNDDIKPKKKVDILSRFRTLARLAAVQALYQIEFMKTGPIIVINQYIRDGICLDEEKMIAIKEPKLFKAIVEGVFERIAEIDQRSVEIDQAELKLVELTDYLLQMTAPERFGVAMDDASA